MVADEHEVVTDVTVTDGVTKARVITFSQVSEDKIKFQTEYWPDPFDAAEWRNQWVEQAK